MSDSRSRRPRGPLLIDEEVRVIGEPSASSDAPEINPYWDDQPQPHPDPSRGCIRRGLCCKSSPGWFAPGEVERAAELMGLTPDDFVKRYLIVDWLELPEHGRVHVFAPVKLGRDGLPLEPTGAQASRLYGMLKGPCVFYQSDAHGCGIYGARPIECRQYICTNAPEDNPSRRELARLWLENS